MSEREKEIMKKVKDALPGMSEYNKGYIAGLADGNLAKKKEEEEEKESD